ncbi:MAG: cellulase family glycosylhydrolase [Deltaproteobacteria bacterium]|nr:cellulase family glycosylhydrolase [Deltaproteobacteria bacterium]MCB9488963.1 cellulase family glycosylhydrolase [Deltaproteobacteria bacterium]
MPRTRWNVSLFALLFVAILLVLPLPSCGDDDDDDSSEDDAVGDDDTGDDDTSDDDTTADDDTSDDDEWTEADWKFIRDDQGRARVLRGCNYDGSAKGDSGLPVYGEEYPQRMADPWGFNFARYLIFWARIEPEEGVYDEDYLDAVETRLDWLAENGIDVVLDMHQDVWGPFAGSPNRGEHSDGAPEWATITDDKPFIDFASLLGGWAFNYISPDVMRAFDNFWDYETHPELQDHYAAMWVHVAERFADHPAVIGFNFMNEPWQGSGLFRMADFDQHEYSDFLQRMIDAVRKVDNDRWIFYEPNAFLTNQGMPNYLRVLDDPREGPNRLAFFPHLYPLQIDLFGGYDPERDNTLANWEKNRIADSVRQQAPLLLGEWAMLSYFDRENLEQWNKEALAMMERVTSGWAYWDCRYFFETFDDDFRDIVAGVYPRATAGTPTSYRYDPETRVFTLELENYDAAVGPTQIYLPSERLYPDGWELSVSDADGTWESDYDAETQVLSVWTDPDTQAHTITIAPAP